MTFFLGMRPPVSQWVPDLKIGSGPRTEQGIMTFYWTGCTQLPDTYLQHDLAKKNECMYSYQSLYINVHSSFICNTQKLKKKKTKLTQNVHQLVN